MSLKGDTVFVRWTAVAVLVCACSGCATQSLDLPSGYGAQMADPEVPADQAGFAREPTMASKILAAIALESVTGRVPDPARLGDQ